MRAARDGLLALHAALRDQGGPVADALVPIEVVAAGLSGGPGAAQVAAAGPRAAAAPREYELLVEMILEGSRLHYGEPALVRDADRDLRLLLGDQLYALGLERLAALGDLAAVGELADVISLVAAAHADGDSERAAAVWDAGVHALGWGRGDAHHAAKALARAGDPRATDALRSVARVSTATAQGARRVL